MELKAKEERKHKLYTLYIHIPAQRSIYKPKQYIFFTKCTCVAVKVPSGLQKWVSPMLYITHLTSGIYSSLIGSQIVRFVS